MFSGYTIKTGFLLLMNWPRFYCKLLIVTQIFGFLKEKEEHYLVLISTCHKCVTNAFALALSWSSFLYWHLDTLQQACILILAHNAYFEARFSLTVLYVLNLKTLVMLAAMREWW